MKNKILVIACLVLVLCVSLVLPMTTAFADYTEDILNNPQAIVNFNQLAKLDSFSENVSNGTTFSYISDYTFSVSGNASARHYIYLLDNVLVPSYNVGDKFYLKVNDNEINGLSYGLSLGVYIQLYKSSIITALGTNDYITLWVDTNVGFNGVYTINVQLTNLSAMFGRGNEPTLQQCQELFVADYYAYNTGSAVSLSGINAFENGYEQGLNAYLKATEFTISSQGFYSSVYTVNLSDDYGFNPIGEGVTVFSKNSSQQSVTVYGSNITNDSSALCLPFKYTLPQGTQITITGSAANVAYNNSMRVYVGFWVGSQMIKVDSSMPTGTQGHFTTSSITFLLPFDVDRIYIITPADQEEQANITLKNFSVGYYLTGAEALSKVNFDNGYAKAEEYYKELYKVGGAMYDSIYYKGYYDYPNDDHFTFKSLITSAVDVPVQAFTNLFDFDILGVNMKTFYLSVFTLCVIFVVLRLVL